MTRRARLIAAALAAFVIVSCQDDKVKPTVDESFEVAEMPAQEGWNSRVVFSDSGKTRAVLNYGHLRMYMERRETLLDSGVVIDFYNKNEARNATLTAKRGKVDDRTNDMYAYDDVVVRNDSGAVLRTEKLKWVNAARRISTDEFFTLDAPSEYIEGYGFESDPDLENYTMYRITYVTNTDTTR
jgi:LPS export ABC transporter protein LptC